MPFATRQKSCDACVRSKRRCDKSYPHCSRCIARHISCVYQRLPPAAYRQRHAAAVAAASVLASSISPGSSSSSSCTPSVFYASSAPNTADTTEVTDYTDSSAQVSSVESSRRGSRAASPVGEGVDTGNHHHVVGPPEDWMAKVCADLESYPQLDMSLSLNMDLDMDMGFGMAHLSGAETDDNGVEAMFRHYLPTVPEYESADDTGYEADVVTWDAPTAASITMIDTSIPATSGALITQSMREKTPQALHGNHISCIIHNPGHHLAALQSFLQQVPSAFANDHKTTFSHHSLYQSPTTTSPLIQDCFACCALYTTRTSSNQDWVQAFVTGRIENAMHVVNSGEGMKSRRDKLAATQAVVMYMAIVMFDSDVARQLKVDDLMEVLRKCTEILCESKMKCEGDEAASIIKAAARPRTWIDWTFRESRRRTIITSYCIQTYWALRNHDSISKVILFWAEGFPYTMSRYLWDAPDAENFFEAWDGLPHCVMRAGVLAEPDAAGVESLRYEDQDDFAKVMMKIRGTEMAR